MRAIRALVRSSLLLALALAGPLAFAFVVLSLCLVLPAPRVIVSTRRLTRLARRLAGVSNEGVYWDPPAPLVPEPDGLYRVDDKLMKSPWWPEFERRLDWATDDPGARRDMIWMITNFFVGGVLAALSPGAVVAGVWLLFTSWWPATVPLVVAGVLAAPALVGVHNQWTSTMLRAKRDGRMFRFWAWVRRRITQWWHATALFLLGFASTWFTLLIMAGALFVHWFGLWSIVWRPWIEAGRVLANLRRELIREWTGTTIPLPYLPKPPPPRPRPDGMYRRGRQLYKKPTMPMRLAMYRWVMTDPATWRDFASGPVDTVVGLFAVVASIFAPRRVLRWQARVSKALLAPTKAAELAQRVQRLTETRTDATDAQAAELRRIERDLHDGAQARLVALGMTLGAVEKLIDQDPELAKTMVAKSREASADALVELRDLVRGIHPPVLAERGLADAVRALALDSPLSVAVEGTLANRMEAPIESAAYFAVSELLVNATKHARADHVVVHLGQSPDALRITVTDDGRGGANPGKGTGLQGLQRRLATFDGSLTLDSPRGGPTVATVHIPTG
ncbi:sensor histidine kinase [Actinocrispum wychmicini]|uniref:histidine kinase n=1 Tax=Actinocrispum wychmicini TaxID=1213861 RepID=A0A4R2JMN8_9PSEU|nr:sensor histidine kinase [Actinocrispum wychmicini]TCO58368.1 histidine kinase [Actinocrispum wychmicini]